MTLRNSGGAACNNTTGRFVSTDARLTVTDPSGAWGNIPSGGSATNSADRFAVSADAGIPHGTAIRCTLFVAGDSADYQKVLPINLVIGTPPIPGMLVMTHDTGYCKLTVSCQGSIGYDEPTGTGQGFCYPKTATTALYYSSFAMGTGADYLADHFYGQPASGATNSDLRPVDSLRAVTPPTAGDEQFRGSYSDAGHPAPENLKVPQNSYQVASPGYDDFVVLTFDIGNLGSNPANGMCAGVFADFDVGSDPTENVVTSDTVRRLSYVSVDGVPNPTVGIKILAPRSFKNLTAIDHAIYVYPTDSTVTDDQKWRFLNGTIVQRNSNRAYDWSLVTSVGPFDLAPGSSYRFAVAFVGGSTEAGIQENADSAQSWYDRSVGVAESPAPQNQVERLLQLAPNPSSGRTTIRFQARVAGHVRVTVVDLAGHTDARLMDREVTTGRGELVWQQDKLADGVYFVRMETPDATLTQRALLVR